MSAGIVKVQVYIAATAHTWGQCSPGYLEETMEYCQTEKPPWSQ